MSKGFVHLNVHSEYSIRDGMLRIPDLVATAHTMGMPAVGLSDLNNVFALVKYYRQAHKQGMHPVVGAELTLVDAQSGNLSQCIALCKNNEGFHNLKKLITKSYQADPIQHKACIQWAWLEAHRAGLIMLSAGIEGDIGQALCNAKPEEAEAHAARWAACFPQHFYLELHRTGRSGEHTYLHHALPIARTLKLPLVATNAVRFMHQDDFEAHEVRFCIQEAEQIIDPHRARPFTEEQYYKSPEAMHALFKDLPSALQNTVEISKRCKVNITLDEYSLPRFPTPDDSSEEDCIQRMAQRGLEEKFQRMPDLDETARTRYQTRLKHELNTINNMGFPGYFLIVADFIRWSKENDVPVGPGRGSGAGSLVAYVLGITNLDPLDYDLLFERFLNPERVSLPDFDVDFCMEGRDRVIEYVAQRYGHDCVSQIITYGSMAAKAVIRDVGRTLGHPYGFVDKLAKLIPFELGMTLKKALEQEDSLRDRYNNETDVRRLLDLAQKLEGLTRNAGKHAGGVVIAPSQLTDFCPLYYETPESPPVTQFDKDDVEAIGLVKFDFLGLRTLTIIKWALRTINATRTTPLDIDTVPLDDPKTFALFKAHDTSAVFQLESRGMKDLIRRQQPDTFEDIIALVALFRPGPLQSGMVDDFIERKHGRAAVTYPHPELEPILKPTYGVILYQEQVMQIAQVLAGYSLGEADLLRRAMGKKKPEEMAKQRTIFTQGAVARGVDAGLAESIFDLMEKFAGYGFNKSHSAAYALIAYQTAYLKAHHPEAFMAAVLSSDMDNTDKVAGFMQDCKAMKLNILPPCINQSALAFTVTEKNTIRFGLGAIKGLGEAAISSLQHAREQGGAFKNLFDFCQRIDGRKLNRRALEAIIQAGAADTFKQNRATLIASLPQATRMAEQAQKNKRSGQVDLFSSAPPSPNATQEGTLQGSNKDYILSKAWPNRQRLAHERTSIGFYFSGHPLDDYLAELKQITQTPINTLRPTENRKKQYRIAGMITQSRTIMTRTGKKMGILTLEDHTGTLDITVFSDTLEQCQHELIKDNVVVVAGHVQDDAFSGGIKMVATKLIALHAFRQQYARQLHLHLKEKDDVASILPTLQQQLQTHQKGNCSVCLHYRNTDATLTLPLKHYTHTEASEHLLQQWREDLGLETEVFY